MAARLAGERFGVNLVVHMIGDEAAHRDDDGDWARLREIDADGAIVVRPDTHVGWRCKGHVDNATDLLCAAMARMLGKG